MAMDEKSFIEHLELQLLAVLQSRGDLLKAKKLETRIQERKGNNARIPANVKFRRPQEPISKSR